jgi:hypothetical protein
LNWFVTNSSDISVFDWGDLPETNDCATSPYATGGDNANIDDEDGVVAGHATNQHDLDAPGLPGASSFGL